MIKFGKWVKVLAPFKKQIDEFENRKWKEWKKLSQKSSKRQTYLEGLS